MTKVLEFRTVGTSHEPGHETALDAARGALDTARAALDAEIRGYPTPISGCDAQYNHLLASRRRVHAAITALDEAVHIPTPRAP